MFQRPGYFITMGLISAAIWCVLSESFSASALLIGFLLGVVSTVISRFLLRKTGHIPRKRFRIGFFAFLEFLFILIRNIYKSGFLAIKRIITEKVNVGIVEIDTELKSPISRALLANSITMTPGTVTIEIQGGSIVVLWLEMLDLDREKARYVIKGELEEILARGERDG